MDPHELVANKLIINLLLLIKLNNQKAFDWDLQKNYFDFQNCHISAIETHVLLTKCSSHQIAGYPLIIVSEFAFISSGLKSAQILAYFLLKIL